MRLLSHSSPSAAFLSTTILCVLSSLATTHTAVAQESEIEVPPATLKLEKALIDDTNLNNQATAKPKDPNEPLYAKFTKMLTGAKLTGQFTLDGKPLNDLTEESYEIAKVEKIEGEDMWVITSRIKYGNKDLTVPVPLQVKWAGTTPVLTLDNLTIPGFGTFSARVVLHTDKYAGTWQHDSVGGHLFGRIEFADAK